MLSSLMLAAFLMGLGGMPHCAAMCGSACAVVFPRGVPLWSLIGRCLAYVALGAVAAASAGAVSSWGRQFMVLQPFWVMAQAAAFALGLWLLLTGQMPALLERLGTQAFQRVRKTWRAQVPEVVQSGWLSRRWLRQLLGGLGWALLPCGLLYAAVMTAALAATPLDGSLVMLSFALPGAWGVWAAPALLARLRGRLAAVQAATPVPVIWMSVVRDDASAESGAATACASAREASPVAAARVNTEDIRWAIRLSGAMLAAMSAWGAYHLVLAQWRAWCA